MTVHQETLELATTGHGDMHDVTEAVADVVRASGVATGLVNVHVVGSTGAVGTIEYEPGLKRDLPEMLNRLMPPGRQARNPPRTLSPKKLNSPPTIAAPRSVDHRARR